MAENQSNKIPKRNKWQPPKVSKNNYDAYFKWCDATHFFLEWDVKENWIYHCFDVNPALDETVIAALNNKDLYQLNIFEFDIENRNEVRLALIQKMEHDYVHFFKEVLEIEAFTQGYMFYFDLVRIALPNKKYDEIMQVINEFDLTDISELIFYIISKAQIFFHDKVFYLEYKKQKSQINNIGKEVKKAIELVELVANDYTDGHEKYKSNQEILRINFLLNNKTIQIKDPFLTKDFVKSFKASYSDGIYKNWKLQLHLMSYMYDKDKIRLNFKYHFAIALYNFFTQTGKIKIQKGKPYPNNLMECIYKILEFSLIKFGKPDVEMPPAHKIRTVRNWIKNHDLKPEPPLDKIEPDFKKLNKYFDTEFINCIPRLRGITKHDIEIGLNLCLMFKTQHLQDEIIYLVACLKEWHWRVSQQLETGPLNRNNPIPKEYETLKLFINSPIANKQFDNITFKITGDEKTYTLSDKFPMYLLNAAIKNHYKNFREDYEFDILQAETKRVNEEGSFSINLTGNFNLPEDRFLPKVIDAFFNFLQNEAPKLEREYKPSDRYYMLIAKALHFSGYLRSQFLEDWELKSKVVYWHSLIKKTKENNS